MQKGLCPRGAGGDIKVHWSLGLDYRVSMPRISDLHASIIGSLCQIYQIYTQY